MGYSIKHSAAGNTRRKNSKIIREKAAQIAFERGSAPSTKRHRSVLVDGNKHENNSEEVDYIKDGSFMSFSKGLQHDPKTGFPVPGAVSEYRNAVVSGDVRKFDAIDVGNRSKTKSKNQSKSKKEAKLKWTYHNELLSKMSIGDQHRRWESPTAGFVYELQGPDAQAVTMPPAPTLVGRKKGQAGEELTAEMAEVYLFALLRDVPFASFSNACGLVGQDKIDRAVRVLRKLPFYNNGGNADRARPSLPTRANVLRGQTPGEELGPYLSQFMLLGDSHLGAFNQPAAGMLQYGSINIDHRVRVAHPNKDYMTHWDEWLDVQHGANVRDTQTYVSRGDGPAFRFIATPRDMATYVHFDALYEAYLNACIWLLNSGAPVDKGFSSSFAKTRSTEGFALFGGPHILTLVTEVATRALKAVRYQKFNNHLRARPEVLAARIAAVDGGAGLSSSASKAIGPMHNMLSDIGLLDWVKEHNENQNQREPIKQYLSGKKSGLSSRNDLPLLPMAFAEGSPMHPAYGAGHATVAGACVTMLKAFFDEDAELIINANGRHQAVLPEFGKTDQCPICYEPSNNGAELRQSSSPNKLKVGHELNKLAANISIGRNMSGVHYYTDYIESMRMGEAIAIGILEEQALTYTYANSFSMSFTTFDNLLCEISSKPLKGQCSVTFSDKSANVPA
jgi:hypothetical protein